MNGRTTPITAIPMPTVRPGAWVAVAGLFLGVMLVAGCSKRGLKFEEYSGGKWRRAPWELTQARVQRDAGRVLAHFVIEGPQDERLILESRLAIDPEVSFQSGTWTYVRGNAIAGGGVLRASSLDFLGGQGGTPSIGGRFELRENDGTRRYRAAIPPTRAAVVKWP